MSSEEDKYIDAINKYYYGVFSDSMISKICREDISLATGDGNKNTDMLERLSSYYSAIAKKFNVNKKSTKGISEYLISSVERVI